MPALFLPSPCSPLARLVWPLAVWLRGSRAAGCSCWKAQALQSRSPVFRFCRLSAWPGTEWALSRYVQNKCERAAGTHWAVSQDWASCAVLQLPAAFRSLNCPEGAEIQQRCPPGGISQLAKQGATVTWAAASSHHSGTWGSVGDPGLSEHPQLSQAQHDSRSRFPGSGPGL